MIVAALAIGAYVWREAIAAEVPAVAPAIESYGATVDGAPGMDRPSTRRAPRRGRPLSRTGAARALLARVRVRTSGQGIEFT